MARYDFSPDLPTPGQDGQVGLDALCFRLGRPARPAIAAQYAGVTFKFKGLSSPLVYQATTSEMDTLFSKTALAFEWKRLDESAEFEPAPNLVVVRLRAAIAR